MTYTEDDLREAFLLLEARTLTGQVVAAQDDGQHGGRPRRSMAMTAAGVAVAACSVGAAALATHWQSDPSPAASTSTTLTADAFPLDAYVPNPDQQDLLYGAQYALVNQCAARLDIPLVLNTQLHHRSDFPFLYGASLRPVTHVEAATVGYHMPESGVSPVDDAIGLLTDEQQAQIVGSHGAGGCFEWATRQLTGTPGSGLLGDDQMYVDSLISASVDTANGSADVKALYPAWSDCMADAGFDGLDNPQTAIREINPAAPVTTAEVNQAESDVSCKESTGLTSAWASVIRSTQSRLLSDNQSRLEEVRLRLGAALQRAQGVLDR